MKGHPLSSNCRARASGCCRAWFLFESRELSLAALDGIRGDLASRGEAGSGSVETSGVLEHSLGQDEASSVFFIEDRALVRLTVTGPERLQRLEELAAIARNKLEGG